MITWVFLYINIKKIKTMNWKIIFNPYSKISDKLLLTIGIFAFVIGILIHYFQKTIHDGILDSHPFPNISLSKASTSIMINIVVLCIILFLLGKIINVKTRMIDVLNTAFISRIPYYIIPFIVNSEIMIESTEKIMFNPSNLSLQPLQLMLLMVFSVILLVLMVYSIVLIINGFRTATNAKKWQNFVGSGIAIIIAEIISKLLINSFLAL